MRKCGLINVLSQIHEGFIPNTRIRGSVHIDPPMVTAGLAEQVLDVGLLDRSVLQSDHSDFFVDLRIEVIFGQHPDKLAPRKFRNLKLDDPIISDKYQKILHTQFECHNIYRWVKKISERGK
jgi:hypothetical protein